VTNIDFLARPGLNVPCASKLPKMWIEINATSAQM
jgi:hypothetical protein